MLYRYPTHHPRGTHPLVSQSRVSEELEGKGYGAALYVYTARKLAEHGQVLKGSNLQSPSAQKLWSKFKNRLPAHVGSQTYADNGKEYTVPVLDFR
jgi:hypothetical protein